MTLKGLTISWRMTSRSSVSMAAHRTTVQSKPARRQYGISGGEYCSLRVSVLSTVMVESLLKLPLTVI